MDGSFTAALHHRRAKITRVIDGDTVEVLLNQDYGDFKLIEDRLGKDFAPESEQVGGSETTAYVLLWLQQHDDGSDWPFVHVPWRTKSDTHEIRSFTRYLADIYAKNGDCLNTDVEQFVIDHGYGPGITVPREQE